MNLIRESLIYIASYLKESSDNEGNPIKIYDKPFSLETSLNSLNGSSEVAMYGDRIKKMCKTFLDYDEWLGKIKENDLVYLYEATPEKEVVNGENANYRVDAVLPQNEKILVYFEKRV